MQWALQVWQLLCTETNRPTIRTSQIKPFLLRTPFHIHLLQRLFLPTVFIYIVDWVTSHTRLFVSYYGPCIHCTVPPSLPFSWYTDLLVYPGNRPTSSAWPPGDRWPEHSPASPVPWWRAPSAVPGPHRTESYESQRKAHETDRQENTSKNKLPHIYI